MKSTRVHNYLFKKLGRLFRRQFSFPHNDSRNSHTSARSLAKHRIAKYILQKQNRAKLFSWIRYIFSAWTAVREIGPENRFFNNRESVVPRERNCWIKKIFFMDKSDDVYHNHCQWNILLCKSLIWDFWKSLQRSTPIQWILNESLPVYLFITISFCNWLKWIIWFALDTEHCSFIQFYLCIVNSES